MGRVLQGALTPTAVLAEEIILAGDEGSRKRRHMAPTESPRAVMVNLLEWPLIQTAGGSTHGFAPSGLDRS